MGRGFCSGGESGQLRSEGYALIIEMVAFPCAPPSTPPSQPHTPNLQGLQVALRASPVEQKPNRNEYGRDQQAHELHNPHHVVVIRSGLVVDKEA